ncbi:MAG: DNA mismatch repair protein MutS [Firmicutes bacterium]|nr:DNA mismatch repair protein MutS [Bacillota bacterium]
MVNLRLANVKTRKETGLDYVAGLINVQTPYGTKELQGIEPFYPGQEDELKRELYKTGQMVELIKAKPTAVQKLLEVFMEMKDFSFIIERSAKNTLSVVELYEVKNMLIQMEKLQKFLLANKEYIPEEFFLEDNAELLNLLDPEGSRINTFYIYDSFSEKLAELRKEKREFEIAIRKEQRALKDQLKEKYDIILTPKFEISVQLSNKALMEKCDGLEELEKTAQDYMTVTYGLRPTPEVYELQRKMEDVNTVIEEEEEQVRERLSRKVSEFAEPLTTNCDRLGKIDFHIAKAYFSIDHNCVPPTIVQEHVVEFEDGRHVQVEDILKEKGKEYCPVSISLKEGVTCITGANMGGKTVSLKLVGLVAIMAQYGFFVPCKSATVGLSNYMQILIGDSQSLERGLSSFGSEMEELKEIFDNSKDRSLILVDEIASGTNPLEATALTRAIVDYLKTKPYIVLMTTHFEAVTLGDVTNLQVIGLAGADFSLLQREIAYATRRERINIIGKYMDYRLARIEKGGTVPKDALNIAMMLGIGPEIIDRAKELIEEATNYRKK